MAAQFLYVAALDLGYEGHRAPYQAWEKLEEACAGMRLLTAGYTSSWCLYRVPLWPAVHTDMCYGDAQKVDWEKAMKDGSASDEPAGTG